jgi:hypothetical protein
MSMAENIDAERAAFEASGITGRLYRNATPGGTDYYEDSHTEMAWRAWQAARRASASIGEDGLPEAAQGVKTWQERVTDNTPAHEYPDAMRAEIADLRSALHSLRAAYDAAISQAGETIDARNEEIVDLRAQLARQGEPVAWKYRALAGNGEWRVTLSEDWARSVNGDVDVVPLYAAPPLSSEQQAEPVIVNVRDFGAVGDGVADDTAAFQRAVDAAGEQEADAHPCSMPGCSAVGKASSVIPLCPGHRAEFIEWRKSKEDTCGS